jgi:hypothetical protein
MRTIKAALAYWACVFALAFVVGALRVTWLAPRIGEVAAVLIEVPVILAASWIVARVLVRRFGIGSAGHALAMGAMAFALLMASEALLAVWIGEGVAVWLAGMASTAGAIGLAGQVGFAVMPVVVRPATKLAH